MQIIISTSKNFGDFLLLNRDLLDIAAEFVFDMNNHGIPFHVKDYRQFISDSPNVDLSDSTTEIIWILMDFHTEWWATKEGRPSLIWIPSSEIFGIKINSKILLRYILIDRNGHPLTSLTFTSHRAEDCQSLSNKSLFIYNNCIIACLWIDEANRRSSILSPTIPQI